VERTAVRIATSQAWRRDAAAMRSAMSAAEGAWVSKVIAVSVTYGA
jgi:hypothetical protein